MNQNLINYREYFTISSFIVHLRQDKEITQKVAADGMGITRRILSTWESGKTPLRDINDLNKIAKYYDVELLILCTLALPDGTEPHTHVNKISIEISQNSALIKRAFSYIEHFIRLI